MKSKLVVFTRTGAKNTLLATDSVVVKTTPGHLRVYHNTENYTELTFLYVLKGSSTERVKCNYEI